MALSRHLGGLIKFAIRKLAKSPLLTISALVALSVGIAGPVTVGQIASVLAREPLPVRDSGSLYLLRWRAHNVPSLIASRSHGYDVHAAFPYAFFVNVEQECSACGDVIASTPLGTGLSHIYAKIDNERVPLTGDAVSGGYFTGLGIMPSLGRLLNSADENHHEKSVVISYELWSRMFNRSASVVGTTIYLGRTAYRVVGVTPPGFVGLQPGRDTSFFVLIDDWPQTMEFKLDDTTWWLNVLVRFPNERQKEVGTSQLRARFQRLVERTLSAVPPSEKPTLIVEEGRDGLGTLKAQLAQYVAILWWIACLGFLFTCTSVATLFLSRIQGRSREFAIRLALGESRLRMLRGLCLEYGLLCVCSCIVGWGLAIVAGKQLAATLSLLVFRLGLSITWHPLGPGVILTVLLFTISMWLLCMVFPVVRALLTVPAELLRGPYDNRVRVSGIAIRGGEVLLVVQLAISMILIIEAGLLLRTLRQLGSEDVGFNSSHIVLVDLHDNDTDERRPSASSYKAITNRLDSVSGFDMVSVATLTPMSSWDMVLPVAVPGITDQNTAVGVDFVGRGFFETIGIRIVEGRGFSASDLDEAEVRRNAVVSTGFARRYFKDGQGVGREIEFAGAPYQVVGVAGDVKYKSPTEGAAPRIYLPYTQFLGMIRSMPNGLTVMVKTQRPQSEATEEIRKIVAGVDKDIVTQNPRSLDSQIAVVTARQHLLAQLLRAFCIVAFLLSVSALYGNVSHMIARRRRELALRIALGARPSQIILHTVVRSAAFVVASTIVGGLAGIAANRVISSQLYGVKYNDPIVLVVSFLVLFITVIATSYAAARDVNQIAPAQELRTE